MFLNDRVMREELQETFFYIYSGPVLLFVMYRKPFF